ncbi:hypothetical protein MMC07_006615 [Pseudocyphellaria aurata]|nr:hypothetical protein [Pseudocyphellaria aurata]
MAAVESMASPDEEGDGSSSPKPAGLAEGATASKSSKKRKRAVSPDQSDSGIPLAKRKHSAPKGRRRDGGKVIEARRESGVKLRVEFGAVEISDGEEDVVPPTADSPRRRAKATTSSTQSLPLVVSAPKKAATAAVSAPRRGRSVAVFGRSLGSGHEPFIELETVRSSPLSRSRPTPAGPPARADNDFFGQGSPEVRILVIALDVL